MSISKALRNAWKAGDYTVVPWTRFALPWRLILERACLLAFVATLLFAPWELHHLYNHQYEYHWAPIWSAPQSAGAQILLRYPVLLAEWIALAILYYLIKPRPAFTVQQPYKLQ